MACISSEACVLRRWYESERMGVQQHPVGAQEHATAQRRNDCLAGLPLMTGSLTIIFLQMLANLWTGVWRR